MHTGRMIREEAFEPKVFISGVAFAFQGQLYEAFRQKGAKTIAFWDNFNPTGTDLYFTTAQGVQKQAEYLWVPTHFIARSAGFADREKLSVVGHPSLETWICEAKQVSKEAIREYFAIQPEKKLAVFIGGYGAHYEAAFHLLIQYLEDRTPKDLFVLVQPHPKYAGRVESEILGQRTSNRALPLRISDGKFSTIEAVASSDILLCHQSTVGFQALFLGKPVIHLIPPGQTFSSLSLEQGWSKKVSEPAALHQALQHIDQKMAGSLEATLGLPSHATEHCAQFVLELVHQ